MIVVFTFNGFIFILSLKTPSFVVFRISLQTRITELEKNLAAEQDAKEKVMEID